MYKPEGMSAGSRGIEIDKGSLNSRILEAEVIKCDKDLNLYVLLGDGMYGVIPYEEYEFKKEGERTKPIAVVTKVGNSVVFKVREIKVDAEGKEYAILSRKDAQEECINNYIDKLDEGDIIDVGIQHIEKYGIFCDVGCGITALMPVKYVSVARINDIRQRFRKIKQLRAVVKGTDDRGRLVLSHKELLGTWEEEVKSFKKGDIVTGIVSMIKDYGVFIELTPNLVGLADVNENVNQGDKVVVYIKSINKSKMKIRLHIISIEDESEIAYDNIIYKTKKDKITDWVYFSGSELGS